MIKGTSSGQPHGSLDAASSLFHGFSDPSRLSILRHLALGDHRVVDLTAHLGLAQSTVSAHLRCLSDCGLVSGRAQGRATVYSLQHAEVLDDLWKVAEGFWCGPGTHRRCVPAAARPQQRTRHERAGSRDH